MASKREIELKQEILGHIGSEPISGLRRIDVQKRLGNISEKYFKELFRELVRTGKLSKKRGGKYVLSEAASKVTGIFHRNPRGFGFVTIETCNKDVFIPQEATLDAMNGDKVQISIESEESHLGPKGKVLKILERAREDFVGCLAEINGAYIVRPLRRDLPGYIPLHQDNANPELNGAQLGDWVQAAFFPRTDERAPLEVTIARRLGKSGTVTSDLNAVCQEFGIPRKYAASSEENATKLIPLELPREDLSDMEMITIDPVDAKDFDDGITYRELPDGNIELGVHIADVACFVQHGTPLDRAARMRGFTNYLPGRTIGMLPDALSSDRCSLREGEKRLAHSVFMTIRKRDGKVLSFVRKHTIVRSVKRLCFDQVDRLLAGESQPDLPENVAELVQSLGRLAIIMRRYRKKTEKYLPFSGTEVRILCAGNPPRITDIVRKQPGTGDRMIEEFMLAANTCVARELTERHINGFFRIHDPIEPDSLTELAAMAGAMFGRKFKLHTREDIIELIRAASEAENGEALTIQIIRCLPRATFSSKNTGHFGLGKELYCHFTSPIRRYPDLFTHQQLIAVDLQKQQIPLEKMQELEMAVNALEQNCDQASFAISDRLKMRKLQEDIDTRRQKDLECTVTRAVPAGLSLYIPKYGLMAFMPIEYLDGRNWHFDQKRYCITNNHEHYKCGDLIYARPRSIDLVKGEILMRRTSGSFQI